MTLKHNVTDLTSILISKPVANESFIMAFYSRVDNQNICRVVCADLPEESYVRVSLGIFEIVHQDQIVC